MNPQGTISEVDILRTRVSTLEQLLDTYEQTVAVQTERLLDSAEQIKRQSSVLRALVSATDPSHSGDFFHSIVYHLAAVSQAKYVVVGEYVGTAPRKVQTIAVWGGEDFAPNFSYDLAGTPCAALITERLIVQETGVQGRFPEAVVLADLNVDGYCGAPIYGTSGVPLGVLAILDDKPVRLSPEIQSVLMLFAARAGAELERRRAEEALRASEERFRAFLDHAPNIAFLKDLDGRYLYTNRRFSDVLHVSGDRVLGRTDVELFDREQACQFRQHDRRVLETEEAREFEESTMHADGLHTSIVVKFPLRDADGRPYAIGGIATDITERKRVEETLREQQTLLRSLIESTTDAIFLKDNEGRYVLINSAVAQVMGRSPAEIVGRTDEELFPPDVAARLRDQDRRVFETGHASQSESVISFNGEHRTFFTTKTPRRDPQGVVTGLVGISRDITDRIRAERELSTLFDNASDVIARYDREGRIIRVNRAIERATGLASESALGKTIYELGADPATTQLWRQALETAATTTRESQVEFEFVTPQGKRWYQSRVIPEFGSTGEVDTILVLSRDVTDQKRMQEALRQSEERLALAVQGSTDAIWDEHRLPGHLWNDPENPIWWSPRIREILTLDDSEPFDTLAHWAQRLHPDDVDRVFGALHAHLEHRTPFDVEYRLRTGRGDYRWIRGRGQAVWDAQDEPYRMSGSCQDITERKEAEAALRASQERYARATAVGKVGVWELDVARGFYQGDTNLKALFGYRADELSTDPFVWLNLVHPEDRSIALEHWNRVINGETDDCNYELRMQRKDGTTIWTEVRGHAVRNPDGQLTHLIGATVDITERKQAEDRLRESERRLRLTQFAVDHAGDAILWADENKRFIYANDAACQSLGYTREELLTLSIPDIAPLHDPASFEERLALLKLGRTGKYESVHRTKDGRTFPIEVSISYLEHEGRGFTCGIARDITERKRMEAELREAIDRFDLAVRGSQDGLWDGRVLPGLHWSDPRTPVWWSPRTRELLGFEPDEFPNVLGSWLPLIHPDDRERVFAALTATAEQQVPYDIEYRLFTKSGEVRWHRAKGQGVWDEQGRPLRMAGSTSDITEQKLAEQALRESEERYRSLVDLSPCGIFVYCEGKTVYVNRAACRLLGADSPEQILDQPTLHFVHPDCHTAILDSARSLFASREPVRRAERKYLKVDRTVIDVEVEAAPIMWNGKPAIQGIFSDITERKRAEEALYRTSFMLTTLVQSSPVAIVTSDIEGRVTGWNPAAERMFGWTESEVLGDQVPYIPPDKQEEAEALWQVAIRGETTQGVELRRCRKDGSPIDIEFWGGSLRDRDGTVTGAFGVMANISERKRTEEQQRARAARMVAFQAALVELARLNHEDLAVPAAFRRITEIAAHAVNVSRVGVWLFREDRSALVCYDLYSLDTATHEENMILPTADYPRYIDALESSVVVAAHDVRTDERVAECREGYLIPFGIASTMDVPIRRQGKVVGVVGFEQVGTARTWTLDEQNFGTNVADMITIALETRERVEAEEEVRQSEERFRAMVQYSSDIITILNPDATIRYESPAFYRLFGYREQDILGHNAFELVHPDDLEHTTNIFRERLYTPGLADPIVFRFRKADGTYRTLEVVGNNLLHDPTVQGIVVNSRDVTERLRAEQALRASEELFAKAFRASPNPIGITELETGRCIDINDACLDLFGFRREEVVGQTTLLLGIWLDPEDRARLIQRLKTGGPVRNLEMSFRIRSGELRHILVSSDLVELNGALCLVTVGNDITERKKAESALRESEELFAKAFRSSPYPIVLSELNTGRILDTNDAAYQIFGYRRDEVVGRTAVEINLWQTPELRERFVTYLKRAGSIRNAEVVLRNKAGELRCCMISAEVIELHGKPCMVTVGQDITEQKRAEEELRNSHTFIRQIIDTDPNFIFAKDREGRFTLVNKAVAEAYGTTAENLIGKTDADFNPNGSEVEFFRQKDTEVIDQLEERFIPEERITDAAGRVRWLQTVKRPILDAEGRGIMVLGASTDITERKRIEEKLRQRERDLRRALDERERISQDLHDGILQSLYAVGLGLETCKSLLLRDAKKAAQTLDRGIAQLNGVMREVRNFIAGLESEVLQGRDLSSALRSVIDSLAQPHHLPVRVSIEQRAVRHLSREQSLHVLNIVREAMSNCLRHARARHAQVTLKSLKHHIRLTVRDDGIGFRPGSAAAAGHGLTNMAARAKKLGAGFAIDSKPRAGTRIILDLPKEVEHAGTEDERHSHPVGR